jgi:cytoskeleton protein RodZ
MIIEPPIMPKDVDQNDHTDLAVGEILRRARIGFKLSYSDVHTDLRISTSTLEALETSQFHKLPGQAYVIGYVRTYADYLQLDAEKLVALLKEQHYKKAERPVHSFPTVVRDRIAPPSWVIISSAIALLVILLLWSLVTFSASDHSIPPVPKELTAQLTPPPKPKEIPKIVALLENAKIGQTAETNAEQAILGSNRVLIKSISDSWIDVRDAQGETVFSRVLKKGEEFWVPLQGGNHTLTTGNAGGILIVKNGASTEPLGNLGEVVRNYSLD